jgi:hypothetical protein
MPYRMTGIWDIKDKAEVMVPASPAKSSAAQTEMELMSDASYARYARCVRQIEIFLALQSLSE